MNTEQQIKSLYSERHEKVLKELAIALESDLKEWLAGTMHIDRISARAKGVDRFVAKATKERNGERKYDDPLKQIQDQVGARITCFYLNDVEEISAAVLKYYTPIEEKDMLPESESEFGYVGKHFVLHFPSDCINPFVDRFGAEFVPQFFELQIKTLFQHAWSEASHDLAYKPGRLLTGEQKRKVAFTAAQAWGADMIFEELSSQLG